MKKLIRTSVYLSAVALCGTACEDNRLNDMADDKIYIVNSDGQSIDVINFDTYTHYVAVSKSGYGSKDAQVRLAVDLDVLSKYNERNGTHYELLPSQCFWLQANATAIAAAEDRVFLPVGFNTSAMAILKDREKYVLPLKLTTDSDVEIYLQKNMVVLIPVFKDASLQLLPDGLTPEQPIGIYADDSYVIHTTVSVNYKNEWDLTYKIGTDPSYVNAYNASNGTSFIPLPADAFELKPDEWTLPAGTNEKKISVTIIKKNLMDENGDYLMGDYVIPMKITEVSKWNVNPDNLQLLHVPFQASKVPKAGWELLAYNSAYSDLPGNEWLDRGPGAVIDDVNAKHTYADVQTFWLADWTLPLPYWMVFDMKARHKILRIELTMPLGGDNWRRSVKKGSLYVSEDNLVWTHAGDFEKTDKAADDFAFDLPQPVDGRYIRLEFTENYGNDTGVAVMNLEVIGF
ncbi:MAG: DUF1735 domain-containing protein [Bacteroidales bacterium]|jgi:hypothetical protein|nr:DUF1735 domain-containing protein [Bacteroidales bacterium]